MENRSEPMPCNSDLFENGVQIALIGDCGGSNHFEQLIQAASRRAGVPIDWHFAGGRARVLAYEKDAEKAEEAMNMEVHPVLRGGAPVGTVLVREDERIL